MPLPPRHLALCYWFWENAVPGFLIQNMVKYEPNIIKYQQNIPKTTKSLSNKSWTVILYKFKFHAKHHTCLLFFCSFLEGGHWGTGEGIGGRRRKAKKFLWCTVKPKSLYRYNIDTAMYVSHPLLKRHRGCKLLNSCELIRGCCYSLQTVA